MDIRKHFFSQRVVNAWNKLPQYVVDAPSVNSFKNRLDNLWKDMDVTALLNKSIIVQVQVQVTNSINCDEARFQASRIVTLSQTNSMYRHECAMCSLFLLRVRGVRCLRSLRCVALRCVRWLRNNGTGLRLLRRHNLSMSYCLHPKVSDNGICLFILAEVGVVGNFVKFVWCLVFKGLL